MKTTMTHSQLAPMKCPLSLMLAIGLTVLPAFADFEKWTNKEGKTVSMEFVRFLEVDGEKGAEFRMVNGSLKRIRLSVLAESDLKRLIPDAAPEKKANPLVALDKNASVYDKAIHKLRSGQEVPAEDIETCRKEFLKYHNELSKKNGVPYNTGFSENDRTDCYIQAVKMAIIDYPQHGGWPFRSDLRLTVLGGLKKRIKADNDPFVVFCAIFPALDGNDVDFAAESMNKLIKDDPFLAKLTERWLVNFWIRSDERAKRIEPFLKATGITLPEKDEDE